MENTQLPEQFVKLFSEFREVFTAPTFNYFQVIVAGILLAPPKKAITRAVRLAHLQEHFSNVHGAVSQCRRDAWELGLTLLDVILRTFRLGGRLTFALDSSVVPKYGRKIFGCRFHFNRDHKHNMARYIWGHDWVIMGLVCYVSLFRKWLCLPFLAKLRVPQTSLPRGPQDKNPVEIVVLRSRMRRVKAFVKQYLILAIDGAFARRHLNRSCIGEHVILTGRLQRKRTFVRLSSIPHRATARSTWQVRQAPAFTYQLFRVAIRISVLPPCPLWQATVGTGRAHHRLVEGSRPHHTNAGRLLRGSTQASLLFLHRSFALSRRHPDAGDHPLEPGPAQAGCGTRRNTWVWRTGSVECSWPSSRECGIPLTCVADALLILWSYQEASHEQSELWDPLPLHNKKSTPSMQDMVHQLHCRTTTSTIFGILGADQTNAQKSVAIRRIPRVAA